MTRTQIDRVREYKDIPGLVAPDAVPLMERPYPKYEATGGKFDREEFFRVYPELRCKNFTKGSKKNGGVPQQCDRRIVVGYDVCYLHGANPGNEGGRPRKDGMPPRKKLLVRKPPMPIGTYERSLVYTPRLSELYAQYWRDPELTNLQSEIAMVRAMLADYAEQVGKSGPLDIVTYEAVQKHLSGLTEQIGKLVERKHKFDYGESHTITITAMNAYATRIAEIILTYVSNPNEIKAIKRELAMLFGPQLTKVDEHGQVIDGEVLSIAGPSTSQ